MSATTPTERGPDGGPRWRIGLLAMIAVGIAVVVVLLLIDTIREDEAPSATSAPPATTVAPTIPATAPPTSVSPTAPPTTAPATTTPATTAQATTAPATTAPDAQFANAIWPWPASGLRYDDPVDAVRGFATQYVGFTDPVLGEFLAGDSRSGEVTIAGELGPVTTVFVRQLGDDGRWWVIGSATPNIVVVEPDALAVIASPLALSGEARAFEGTVNVEIRADGVDKPLFSGFVTGGGGAELGPFEDQFEFADPGEATAGAILFLTYSPQDGSVVEVGALRVFFASD